MENDKASMTRVTNGISAMRGLLISSRFLIALTAIIQFLYIINKIRLYSPLYILLLALIFPMIMEGMIKGHANMGDEEDLPLPLLRKKYGFSFAKSKAHSFAFLLNVIMLIAWHYNYTVNPPEQEALKSLPAAILIAYVLVRLLLWLFYLLMFKFAPTKLMK